MNDHFGKMLLLLGLLLLPSFITHTQTAQQKKSDDLMLKINTELVVLDAQVVNKKTGRIISGLKKEGFILSEDGIKQEITHFGYDSLPLSIVLLVDDSGSVAMIRDEIQDAAVQSLQHLKTADEVALMGFTSAPYLIQEFTTNRHLIADKTAEDKMVPIGGWDSVDFPRDGTRIADSIYKAAEYLHKAANPAGRRVVIVVTDNYASAPGASYTENEVTDQLFESGSTVYGLIIDGGIDVATRTVLRLGRMFSHNGGNVNNYAGKTGGLVLDGRKHKVTEKLTEIIGLLRQRYSFGYIPTNAQMDGTFRKIKLRVTPEVEKREGGVIILAKQGYYARRRDSAAKPAQEKPPAPKNN